MELGSWGGSQCLTCPYKSDLGLLVTCGLSGSVVGNLLSRRNVHSCPFLFKSDIVLMGESQGYRGLLLQCQVDSEEQGRKSLSLEVTMTNLSSLLTETLPFELGD